MPGALQVGDQQMTVAIDHNVHRHTDPKIFLFLARQTSRLACLVEPVNFARPRVAGQQLPLSVDLHTANTIEGRPEPTRPEREQRQFLFFDLPNAVPIEIRHKQALLLIGGDRDGVDKLCGTPLRFVCLGRLLPATDTQAAHPDDEDANVYHPS